MKENFEGELLEALKEAWGDGFQAAIDTLRTIGTGAVGKKFAPVIESLAACLEDLKPGKKVQ